MNIEVFSLCDAATADHGKLNMLGAFDTVMVEKVPATHSQCAVALRMRFESVEEGEHKVGVSFIDVNGKNIMPAVGGPVMVKHPEGRRSVSINLILSIHNLKFERPGEYSIELAIDGRHEASLPLFVHETAKRA